MKKPKKKVERKGAEIRVEAMKKRKKRWRERVPKSELRHEETQKRWREGFQNQS